MYNSIVEKSEYEKRQGEIELGKHGYTIGDTVYLDGVVKGVIDHATLSSPIFGSLLTAFMVFVKIDAKVWREHFGSDEHKHVSSVVAPCTISNIQKERAND